MPARRRTVVVMLNLLLNAAVLTAALTTAARHQGEIVLHREHALSLSSAPVAARSTGFGVSIPPVSTAPLPPAKKTTGSRQDLGQAALALIRYPWRDLNVTVAFLPQRRGVLGKTFPDRSRIEMYVRPNQTATQLAYMLAHEIGHMVDWRYGSSSRRAQWKQLRGIPAAMTWYGNAFSGGDDLATPAGDFAETFAYWLIGPVDYKSRLAPPPTAAQLDRLKPLFVRP